MPALLRPGSEVSSTSSKTAKFLDPPPGKKRRVRERVYGVIMRSLENGMWEVQLAGGGVEEFSPRSLKCEGEPTQETLELVQVYNNSR